MRRQMLALTMVLLALAACTATSTGPLWTPDTPRNGATQPVDPVYGTPIPGYPLINGG
jgi:predicted small lipoprotein YifL